MWLKIKREPFDLPPIHPGGLRLAIFPAIHRGEGNAQAIRQRLLRERKATSNPLYSVRVIVGHGGIGADCHRQISKLAGEGPIIASVISMSIITRDLY
jgi:hypothetical protein